MLLQSHVDLSSKHCQVCKKCVIGFDHHCLWLNCCIGSRNYPPFILLLSLSILLFSMHLTVAVVHLIGSYTEPEASAESPLGDMPMAAMRVRSCQPESLLSPESLLAARKYLLSSCHAHPRIVTIRHRLPTVGALMP